MKKSVLLKLINLWPPFIGAGIRVKRVSPDLSQIEVEMKLRFWNRNYVGTHFGGSLYAMTDPFFMLMLMERLGQDYIVWDKAASIHFKKPGKSRVHATFHLPEEKLNEIRAQAVTGEKVEPLFSVSVTDDSGTVIAEVEKKLYVRKKRASS